MTFGFRTGRGGARGRSASGRQGLRGGLRSGAALLVMTCALNAADICVPQPAGGPGANGPYGMIADTVRTGDDARDRVFVFLPDTSAGKAPILFFCHRVGATDPREYGPFIRHLVSRGSAVVYPVCGSGVGPL